MWRSTLTLLILTLAVGCDDGKAPPAPPPDDAATRAAPARLIDPLERDKDVLAMKNAGIWQARGKDNIGGQWEGYLVVERDPASFLANGFFEWSCKTGGGRYHFEGTFDPATRQVHWKGFTVKDRFGGVANAHYTAALSPDGRTLLNGSWKGGISVPGTWGADCVN